MSSLNENFKIKNGLTVNTTVSAGSCVEADSFKKHGGTSSQFLKADGSVDSTSYTTCQGDVTGIDAGTAITISDGSTATPQVAVTSACNTAWNNKTTCTGTTTPSNTQTFTNKSGNISQWTNDSGYTTCTGDVTGITTGPYLTGGGASGCLEVGIDSACAAKWDTSATGGVQSLSAGDGLLDNGTSTDPNIAVDSTVVRTSGAQSIAGVKSFSDDLVVDTDTLFVDVSTDQVGINTSTPGEALDVIGNVQVTDGEFIGDLRGAVQFHGEAGENLAAGDAVYISGISGNTTVVSKADANDAAKMPAFGIVNEAATSGNPVEVVQFGDLKGLDTTGWGAEGTELFIDTTAGAIVSAAPTGESSALQKIAKVTRYHASAGSITIMGAGRSNAVPNLNNGKIFIGNGSNQACNCFISCLCMWYR